MTFQCDQLLSALVYKIRRERGAANCNAMVLNAILTVALYLYDYDFIKQICFTFTRCTLRSYLLTFQQTNLHCINDVCHLEFELKIFSPAPTNDLSLGCQTSDSASS